ncbi:MAG: hypothetical protein LBD80_07735 [Tannerella sp.]|jgi:ABC-type uncharacterized transport system substrate-binding protein|nr:hypothetical protein [Tannerella sp.]
MKVLKSSQVSILALVFMFSCKTDDKKIITMVIPASIEAFKQIEAGLREVCTDSLYYTRVFSAEGDASKFNTAIDAALLTKPNYFVAIGSQVVTSVFSGKYQAKMPPTIAGSISIPSSVSALEELGINPPRKFPLNIVSQVPFSSYSKLVNVIFDIKPATKKIGIIYNEAEINSKNMKNIFVDIISKSSAKPLLGAVTSAEDVYNITNKLIRDGAEAIIIPHDKSATTKAATIAKLCSENNVISCCLDDGIIKDGIMFAVSVQYKEVGKLIGKIIRDANENHKDLKQMPIVEIEDKDVHIFINSKTFEEKEIKLSEQYISQIINL